MKAKIVIYLDGREYAMRFWSQIPRQGDLIKLRGPSKGIYPVSEVVWFTEIDNDEVQVNLVLTSESAKTSESSS